MRNVRSTLAFSKTVLLLNTIAASPATVAKRIRRIPEDLVNAIEKFARGK
jgi:hypothetical protein